MFKKSKNEVASEELAKMIKKAWQLGRSAKIWQPGKDTPKSFLSWFRLADRTPFGTECGRSQLIDLNGTQRNL